MKRKMEKMSPEERKRFKDGFVGKWWEVNVWEVDEEEEAPVEETKDQDYQEETETEDEEDEPALVTPPERRSTATPIFDPLNPPTVKIHRQ